MASKILPINEINRKYLKEKEREGLNKTLSGLKGVGNKSRMQKDQDMISGIGARAAKKSQAARSPMGSTPNAMRTSKDLVKKAITKGVKTPDTRPRVNAMGPTPNAMRTSKDLVKKAIKKGVPVPKINLDPPKKAAAKKFGDGDAKTRGGKANVSKKQLDAFGGTLTQYMNQWNKSGKRPTKVSAASKTTGKETADKKAEPKKKSFRERRAERLKKRLDSTKSKGRKNTLERRLKRVKGRMADDEKKPKKMMAGGMMKTKGMSAGGKMKSKGYAVGGMKTKGSMAGGKMKSKGYSAGGVKKTKAKKMRGAGIERRGYRPAKMR